MKFLATGIGVDAGMVVVGCLNYKKEVKEFGFDSKELKRLGKVFDVPNGKYKVNYHCIYDEDTVDEYDVIEGSGELLVTSGKIFIVDPCYVIGTEGNKWGDWLDKTDYGRNLNSNKIFLLDAIHDDGGYDIELNLVKMSDMEVVKV